MEEGVTKDLFYDKIVKEERKEGATDGGRKTILNTLSIHIKHLQDMQYYTWAIYKQGGSITDIR